MLLLALVGIWQLLIQSLKTECTGLIQIREVLQMLLKPIVT